MFFSFSNNCSRAAKSCIKTCLALLPSKFPTIPAASSWSISRPALLYPSFNFLCNKDADPCWAITIISAASLNSLSLSEISISRLVPPYSPTYSGKRCASGYALCEPIKSVIFSTSGVSTKAHWILSISFPAV